ncbi:hypothetical protein FVE85_4535 [Porphyridium purpureum]|uniref:Uncharacterized protein n=1 Tax=Porphyridium purpureum TaxID=35688 RepID=A0A5J4YIQ5_PORPP|nr:hypothetical protein FVE85_4535 [Porphyridium purpureum]|eukprot:POR1667..scf297_16
MAARGEHKSASPHELVFKHSFDGEDVGVERISVASCWEPPAGVENADAGSDAAASRIERALRKMQHDANQVMTAELDVRKKAATLEASAKDSEKGIGLDVDTNEDNQEHAGKQG